jgi:iron complex outermembrane receptor protein
MRRQCAAMNKPANVGWYPVVAAVICCPIVATFAQNSTSPTAGEPGVTIEEVIVTGSNIPTAENVGPHPVDTYRRDDLTHLGVRTATDFIQQLPASTGASVNENNVNGSDGRAEINLRGILPKETLVLQDGRRLAPVGFAGDTVDLNTFPVGLVDHIDILKDGASAIYGTDAVAGVLNVFLIHRFRGLEVYSSYGNANLGFANDQGEERSYILAGSGNDKTDIVVYAEFYNRAAIYARDANISHDADYASFGGLDLRSGNFAGRVESFVYQPNLNGGASTPTPHSFPNVGSDPQYVARSSLPRERRLFNFADLTPAMGPADRQYLYGSFEHNVCEQSLSIFADFKYVRGFWEGDLAPTPFSPDVFTDATHPSGISSSGISVPIQNAFNPFTVPDYVSPLGTQFTTGVRYRALEAGLRADKITTENYEFTAGLKGDLSQFGDSFRTWAWETGFRYSEDHRTQRFSGIANNQTLRAALLDTNPATAFNPFGLNQNSRSVLDKIFVTTNRFGATTLALEDFKVNGDLLHLPAGPISFAIGGEHRSEHASDTPDVLTASGQTSGATNFARTRGGRDVWSIYWEVLVPITSSTWNFPGAYSLELGYQERYEDFSDFGAATRPKAFLRWQPIDSALTFRATYSEAYHAPTLGDLFRGPLPFVAIVNDPKSPATEPGITAQFSGNPNLRPETAYEWTYGAIVTPEKWWLGLKGLTLSADFYHIDIRAVTVQPDGQFVVNHENQFPGQVIRGPSTGPGDPFGPIILLLLPEENLGRMIEEGWDYEAIYSFDTSRLEHGDWGTLTATLNGTYLGRAVLQAFPGGPEQVVVGKFGGGFLGTAAGGSFTHNRWYASLFYDGPGGSWLGGVDIGFTVHYVGQYWDNRSFTFDNHDRKVREWATVDWMLNYTFRFPAASGPGEVPGYTKGDGKNVRLKNGKEKNVASASTAQYNPCGWRAWLNDTTITFGINNVTDEEPPFVAAGVENGYDESTANIKGRTWYVALKKRF